MPCHGITAASRGYGLESIDGLEDPDGSGNYLKTAELAEGFETLDSSAAGLAVGEEDEETLSDGAGMTNQEYGKMSKQAQKQGVKQQHQVSKLESLHHGLYHRLPCSYIAMLCHTSVRCNAVGTVRLLWFVNDICMCHCLVTFA